MGVVYKFKSTDAGAPALSGTVGAFITLLDAVLVNGYNTKTITITRSGSVATASCTTHGFVNGHVLTVSGASQSEYNGTFIITYIDANSFSYVVTGTPATPATGTISAVVAPLGWTKAYSGTNLAAYLQPGGTNGFYLRVDDTNTTYGYFRGYETMSDVNTGTNPFPTVAQQTNPLSTTKSSTADATSRPWKMFSNGKLFYLFTNYDSSNNYRVLFFGDFPSFVSGDAYNTILIATGSSGSYGSYVGRMNATTIGGHYVARAASQSAGALQVAKCVSDIRATNPASDADMGISAGLTYPDAISGGIKLARVYVNDGTFAGSMRGYLPGLWPPCHQRPITIGDTFSGATGTPVAGMTFEQVGCGANGQTAIQTSDWGV